MFRNALDLSRSTVRITVDGKPIDAPEGETVAGVLVRMEPFHARTNPVSDERRAPYCMMGVCFECLVRIDGTSSIQACLVPVKAGMVVERQAGPREVA
ncbi:(2Fe-2S)-binding protein [Chelativorans xinjiangense]|uniref:(2Fe-2S)-binding protein n=1 Tax=Chelativorans xinjiangense TaxID=2681485 RepID=UPI0013573B99|nr:(2Fe-2S)-binding protein [Chelativorans xinjiangense]